MTTIAEKLVLLNSTKTAIANAIEAKGVTVGAVPFADYAAKIADITSGGSTPEPTPEPNITPWVRPDWPALPTLVEGNQRFVGVHAVYAAGSNFCALSAAGNYTVDWGDGVVENYVSNVVAYHTYDFTNVNLSAATSRGYKCAIVSLTPQSGQSLTTLKLHQKHNQANLGMYSSGFLDIAIAGQSLSDLRIGIQTPGSTTQVIRFADLEQVQVISSNAITNFSNMFYNCYSLQSIPLLNTAAGTNFSNMFYNCYSLSNIDATGFKVSFSVSGCKLSAAALNKIYTNLPTVSVKTITVSSNWGTATDNPSIATAKGWTVSG